MASFILSHRTHEEMILQNQTKPFSEIYIYSVFPEHLETRPIFQMADLSTMTVSSANSTPVPVQKKQGLSQKA